MVIDWQTVFGLPNELAVSEKGVTSYSFPTTIN